MRERQNRSHLVKMKYIIISLAGLRPSRRSVFKKQNCQLAPLPKVQRTNFPHRNHGFLILGDLKTYKLSKTLSIKTCQVRKKDKLQKQ